MAYKDPERRRQVIRDAYYANPKGRHAQIKARSRELLDWVASLKIRCSRCPESDPVCLDFHHRDPSDKDIAITRAARNGWSKERLAAEIDKCDVLCANCHRKEHARLAGVAKLDKASRYEREDVGVRVPPPAPHADVI